MAAQEFYNPGGVPAAPRPPPSPQMMSASPAQPQGPPPPYQSFNGSPAPPQQFAPHPPHSGPPPPQHNGPYPPDPKIQTLPPGAPSSAYRDYAPPGQGHGPPPTSHPPPPQPQPPHDRGYGPPPPHQAPYFAPPPNGYPGGPPYGPQPGYGPPPPGPPGGYLDPQRPYTPNYAPTSQPQMYEDQRPLRHSQSYSHSRPRPSRSSESSYSRKVKKNDRVDTFLGAGAGGLVGDMIFPGLGTVGGALLGGYGGHKHAHKGDKDHYRSKSASASGRRSLSRGRSYDDDRYIDDYDDYDRQRRYDDYDRGSRRHDSFDRGSRSSRKKYVYD